MRTRRIKATNHKILRPTVEVISVIEFKMDELAKGTNSRGRCWYDMFRNPAMTSGFSIRAKKERGLGLEVPLNMMAVLAGSDRVIEFEGQVYIKGHTTMLVATKIMSNLLVWHYYFNGNGERLAYYDHSSGSWS